MSDAKVSLKVFLCHAHSDKQVVRDLYIRLTQDGVDAWLDKEKLLPGQEWDREIRKAVREADVVVVCLSKQFNQAGYRQKEVRLALDTAMEKPEGDIFIIPARLEDCEPLDSLAKWQWVDLFENNGYEMLMRALRARAEKIGVTLQAKRRRLSKPPSQDLRNEPVESEYKGEENKKRDTVFDGKVPTSGNLLEPPNKPYKLKTEYIVAIIGAVAVILASLISSPFAERLIGRAALPTGTMQPQPVSLTVQPGALVLATETDFPTLNPTQTMTSGSTSTIIPTPSVVTIPTQTSQPMEILDTDGTFMRLVPQGEFIMGSDRGEPDELPVRTLYLDAYFIDKYEVTNTQYSSCVKAGICKTPSNAKQYSSYDYRNRPVTYMSWVMAKTYCEWRGARLPTEAEWEKAARGVDGNTYPWGEAIDCTYANYRATVAYCVENTTPVGSYEKGMSIYGIYDLAGNVSEWVSSLHFDYPYSATDGRENPNNAGDRILRGGSWNNKASLLRSADRAWNDPNAAVFDYGFRCAKDAD